MKHSSSEVMSLALTLLGVFGLWHGDGRYSACVGRLIRCVALLISVSMELSLVLAYPRVAEDQVLALRALGSHSTVVPTYAMVYSLMVKKQRYLYIMTRRPVEEESPETDRIFSAARIQARRLTAIYLFFGTVYTLSAWGVPLIVALLGPTSSHTRPPYDICFSVTDDYHVGLVVQYIFQSVGIEIRTYMVIFCDMFFITLMLKVIGDFKSLNNALVSLKAGIGHEPGLRHVDQGMDGVLQPDQGDVVSKLSALIQYHQDLLRDVEELRQLMDTPLFVLYVLGSGNLCALAYEVSKAPGFNHQMTSAGSHLSGMVFRLGIYSYYGSEITSESLKTGEALYSSDWLSASMTFKQSCVLVLGRSQHPVRFTAGMFGALSLDMYSRIINTAYSYFTLLKKMQNS